MTTPLAIVPAIATLFVLLFASPPSSGTERPENTWVAEELEGVGIIASVNGRVTHGDRYYVTPSGLDCAKGVTSFSFATMIGGPDILKLHGHMIPALANGEKVLVRISGSQKFFIGRIVFMSMGIYPLDRLIERFKGAENLTIRLSDTDAFKASKYFDPPENVWSLDGFPEALAQAQALCREERKDGPGKKREREGRPA